jgi:transposase
MSKMKPTYEELFSQNQILIQQLKEALAEIQILKAEIKDLKEKLNTNSTNSSQPPSQDPYRKPARKKKTGRNQGAQSGHPGHRRKLYPLGQVQTTHDLTPNECPNCHSNAFHKEAISTEVRQVVELPDAPPQVTQYNIHTCRCACCGKHVKADIPPEAQYGFGPRLMGLVTSLTGEFRLSKRQVVALAGKIGIRICSGSVCKIHERASEILKAPYEEIKQFTLQQKHLCADETSWRTLSQKCWCWIGRGPDSMFFAITTHRSAQAFRDVFGVYKGGITTDRYGAYNIHEGPQQLCWSHADRDFEKIASRDGFDKWVGDMLLEQKKIVFDLWHQFKDGLIARSELIKQIEEGPKGKVKALLKAGVAHENCRNRTKATCTDFLNRFDTLWFFIYNENVEPTNNAAEQGLRHGVIWRKISYGSQSEAGERFVERVMTIAMTLKQRAVNSFEYFSKCFKEFIHGGQSPPVFAD